jgi:hypothetical protein
MSEKNIFQTGQFCEETAFYRLTSCEDCAPQEHVIFVKEGESFPLCFSCFTGRACWKFEGKIKHESGKKK